MKDTQTKLIHKVKSSRETYEALVVGKKGLGSIIKYELLTCLLTGMPGAIGIWLRQKLYPLLFRECGSNVIIDRNVTFRNPGRISLGNNVIISEGCTLDAKGKSGRGIILGNGVFIGEGTIISMFDGTIVIDDYANIGSFCRVGTLRGFTRVGKKALLAAYCYLIAGDHEIKRTDIPIMDQPLCEKGGALIGDGCWLGARVTVMNDVEIGRDTIVGAHSLVTNNLPEFSVAAGIPAKIIKTRIHDDSLC